MKRCIDTCAYSLLMRGDATMQKLMEESEVLYIPTVVIGELYSGFLAGNKCEQNIQQFEAFLDLPGVHIQPVTTGIAIRYAHIVKELRIAGAPIPTNDVWIAATAQDLGATLISCDKHFERISGLLVNW